VLSVGAGQHKLARAPGLKRKEGSREEGSTRAAAEGRVLKRSDWPEAT